MKQTLMFLALASPALAEAPVIESATAQESGSGWAVSVTLSHPDSGWSHYADGWRVLDMEGNQLGMRELLHPHEHEQPFTRSLSGVSIPEGEKRLRIQARCSVDGWAEDAFELTLP